MTSHTPQRIVSLQPSATVILAELGLLERLVACTKYCVEVCPAAGGERTIVADSWTAKSSEILAVRPDLVIAAVPYQDHAVSEILRSGIRFLGLAPHSLVDIYGDIASIAGIMGAVESGERLIARMQREIEQVRQTAQALKPRTVFCEEWGKPLIASQAWVAELVAAAGGEFIGEPGKQVEAEVVSAVDPETLIAAWCGAGDRVPLEKIIQTRGWTGLRAVRQGRVYCIPDEWLNTPAPTLLKGLRALAAAIHPEHFPAPLKLRKISGIVADLPETKTSL